MNAIATAARDAGGQFPPGSAWVKEQVDGGGTVWAIEISRRESDAPNASAWRWWRGTGEDYSMITQDVFDDGFCTPCHADAERDFVFTVVP